MRSSLAIFVHYSSTGDPDQNALLYAEELAKSFDNVIIASNINTYLDNPKIACLRFDKNAYDFGYIYQALSLVNAYEHYNVIGLFNDSNYIINSLDPFLKWCFDNPDEFCGITDCLGGRPELLQRNQHHLQSHFLLFKGRAVKLLEEYFSLINFPKYFETKGDPAEMRKQIIINCEILLSSYMCEKGIRMATYFSASSIIPHIRPQMPLTENIHVWLWDELIAQGYPFIKKKIYNLAFPENDMLWINSNPLIYPMNRAKDIIKDFGSPEYTKTIK